MNCPHCNKRMKRILKSEKETQYICRNHKKWLVCVDDKGFEYTKLNGGEYEKTTKRN